MKDDLRYLQLSNPDVNNLRIMVHGPVGAGKSSFINSIDSIFQDRITSVAIANSVSSQSFTKMYQVHKIKDGKYGCYLPFVISDTMGVEEGYYEGAHPDDLLRALQGHLQDGYMFNATYVGAERHGGHGENNTIHCLVSILPANNLTMVHEAVVTKMKEVRARATELKIPQVALLTKVDEACSEVKRDLKMIYKSKKIRQKMLECSCHLGIPLNQIFPVKNYHEETQLDEDVDILLLSALTSILNNANDHVAEMPPASNEIVDP